MISVTGGDTVTVYDVMPSLWFLLSFLFFAVYLFFHIRVFLLGCGAAALAFAPSVTGAPIRVQTALFFIYCAAVAVGCLIKRYSPEKERFGVAVTDVDRSGGLVLFRGRIIKARTRDPYARFTRGQLLSVRARR